MGFGEQGNMSIYFQGTREHWQNETNFGEQEYGNIENHFFLDQDRLFLGNK